MHTSTLVRRGRHDSVGNDGWRNEKELTWQPLPPWIALAPVACVHWCPVARPEVTGTAGRRTPNQAPQASGNRTGGTEPALVLDRHFDADGLFSLRSAVMAHADELADRTTAEDMVLVAHELATNAVRHGGGRGRLVMWVIDGRLWCEVSDGGPGLPDPAGVGTEPPAPTMPGGRGLWIVRQMSDLTISSTTAGTTIRASVPKG